MFEAAADAIEARVTAAMADAPVDSFARVSVALRTTVDVLSGDPRMIRIFFVEGLGSGGRASVHRNEVLARAAGNFFGNGLRQKPHRSKAVLPDARG